MSGFSSGAMKSVRQNLGQLRKRKFLRNNKYNLKGSVNRSGRSKRKYQGAFDKLAIYILLKLGYKGVV